MTTETADLHPGQKPLPTIFSTINCVEVNDVSGRTFAEHYVGCGAEMQVQDGGRTLKLFFSDRVSPWPEYVGPELISLDLVTRIEVISPGRQMYRYYPEAGADVLLEYDRQTVSISARSTQPFPRKE